MNGLSSIIAVNKGFMKSSDHVQIIPDSHLPHYTFVNMNFDIREFADVGWITGHTYVCYGPLNNGATSIIVRMTRIVSWLYCFRSQYKQRHVIIYNRKKKKKVR